MSQPHDILFVVLDSARKDRVSAFGGERMTTPAFDEIASSATTYQNAFVPAPWTLPSHCSMFTGLFPSEHGITNGFTDRNLALSTDIPTITEQLAEDGYATAGFSNNPWVGQLSGLNRGFDRFVEWDLEITGETPKADLRQRDQLYDSLHDVLGRAAGQPHVLLKRRFFTSNLVERAKRWIATPGDEPRYTFLNLMEAHSPYYPPKSAFRDLGLEAPGRIESRTLNARLLGYVLGKTSLSASHRERIMEYYDASLRYQDRKLASLITSLRAADRFDDAMIVIAADHGKTLGEFDRDATPPHYTRDINVNVPLLIKWPNQRTGEHIDAPVELTDLYDAMLNVGTGGDDHELPTREEGAFIEDFVPHSGHDSADVVRWRCLADTAQKYVTGEEGDEFLFKRGIRETKVSASEDELARYRERLRDRIEDLDTTEERTQDVAESELGGTVEGQLHDLGYLS